ncbi:MAG: glycosyltransferase family 2 protein [Alphaproteobacteria bacterium]|nr:glycosyltransferase family 2 protein [Alphaproteobacteria bacterium]
MKKTPRISVIMPAYNSEKYIGEAIESILNQTFKDFELIIINDGSTDNTAKIVKEYAKKDKRINFVDNKKNQGLISVLNQGIDLCRGEYIARMDSDDISLPTRFAKQIEYMDAHHECGVLGTWFQCFGNSTAKVRHPERIKILNILHDQHVGHPTVMVRKSVMDNYGFYYDANYKHAEDFELWSRMVFVTEIRNLPEILLKYRWGNTNVSVLHATEQLDAANHVKQNILDKLTDDSVKQQMILNENKPGFLLPKWLGRICCLFIFKRENRHNFRDRYVRD